MRQRGSISSRFTALGRADTNNSLGSKLRSVNSLEDEGDGEEGDGVSHPVEPRANIPMLPPVLVSPREQAAIAIVH